jgi:hypothetical protein
MSRQVHEKVVALAGMVDEVSDVLSLAADLGDNGRLDDPKGRETVEAAYEILGRLLGIVA